MKHLNKSTGNMYPWVNFTWNPIRGCEHNCVYCYLKSLKGFDLEPRLIEDALNIKLDKSGEKRIIFVGSSCDMWGEWVPLDWIQKVIGKCTLASDCTFLFQSKNPCRFEIFHNELHVLDHLNHIILGTTIESNRNYHTISNAPEVMNRSECIRRMRSCKYFDVMVGIEPIMDFDLEPLVSMIREIGPKFVSIGADSKGHNLEEPSKAKTLDLIFALKDITEVKIKDNLSRLTGIHK